MLYVRHRQRFEGARLMSLVAYIELMRGYPGPASGPLAAEQYLARALTTARSELPDLSAASDDAAVLVIYTLMVATVSSLHLTLFFGNIDSL